MKGAEETLNRTLGLEIEVDFLQMYKSQPLFGEVVDYLNKFNFEFIDFVGLRR